MVIVLINWRILDSHEQEEVFHQRWKTGLTLGTAKGLIGEFLSRVRDPEFCDRITWQLEPEVSEDTTKWKSKVYRSYVNVGFWESLEDFLSAVRPNMNPPGHMESFEAAPRRRAILTPEAWRLGNGNLPTETSSGVIP